MNDHSLKHLGVQSPSQMMPLSLRGAHHQTTTITSMTALYGRARAFPSDPRPTPPCVYIGHMTAFWAPASCLKTMLLAAYTPLDEQRPKISNTDMHLVNAPYHAWPPLQVSGEQTTRTTTHASALPKRSIAASPLCPGHCLTLCA